MLYQLFEHQFIRKNTYVIINGPWDKYGKIIKYQEHNNTYLITGIGKIKPSECI